MREIRHVFIALALLAAAPLPVCAQDAVQDATQTATDVVKDVKQAADAVHGLPDKGIDAAGKALKDNLPPELAPVADVASQLAKTLADIGDGKLISEAVGTALDKFAGVLGDIVGDNKTLLARLERLEKENTEKMIEIEHSKASLQELDKKLTDTTAVVTELVESHRQQLVALETRIAKLEAERGTVKAPFKVVNAGGKVLFSVVEDGTVTVGTEGQANVVLKTLSSNSALIQVANGSQRVILTAGSDSGAQVKLNDGPDSEVELNTSQGSNGFIRVTGGTSDAIINADTDNAATLHLQGGADKSGVLVSSKPETLGLLAQKGGKNAVSLGAISGKGIALRLYNNAGEQVVSAGPNPAKGDAGLVAVGASGKTAAWISSEADGAGLAQVFAADGTGAAALVGKERSVAAYNQAGNAVATISKSDKSEGGSVVARNPGGEGIFAAGFASEYGGGEACVWRAKRSNTFCLGLGMPGMGVGK